MRTLVASFAILPVLLAATGHGLKRTAVGEPLKNFVLQTADRQPFPLAESLGEKATLVVFWAMWSPRSAEALADYQKLYETYGPRDLQVVAVNVEHQQWDPGERDKVAAFIEEKQFTFPVVVDEDLTVFDAYGVIATPSTILADPQGTIVNILEGYAYMTRFDFRDRILDLLGVLPEKPEEQEEVEVSYRPKGKAARYYSMGMLLTRKGMDRRAMAAFQRAVEEDPSYAEAHLRLAERYEAAGMAEEAAKARVHAAKLAIVPPESADKAPKTLVQEAESTAPSGVGEKGETRDFASPDAAKPIPAASRPEPKTVSRPVLHEPRNNAARFVRMGRLLLAQGKGAMAVNVFRLAVERDPEWSEAYLGLAKALEAEGQAEEAAKARARAASLAQPISTTNEAGMNTSEGSRSMEVPGPSPDRRDPGVAEGRSFPSEAAPR